MKTLRKYAAILLAIILVLSSFASVNAVEIGFMSGSESGKCGENLTWKLDDLGRLTISGNGDMEVYDYESDMPWYEFKNDIRSLVIEDGVTSLAENAFYYCDNLKEISIGNGIKTIGYDTFYCCEALEILKLGTGIEEIGEEAFSSCEKLESVTFPEGLKSIGVRAFDYCQQLKDITLPASVEEIGDRAFNCCYAMENINVDDKNESFCSENGILYNKDKTVLISYPGGKQDTSFTIPESVTSIAKGGFSGNNFVESVTFPSGLKIIGEEAFVNCYSIKGFDIPASVETIEYSAFSWESGLEYINVDDNNKNYCSVDGVLFNKSKDDLICYPANKEAETYSIPNGVINICDESFINSNLKSVTIPEGVKSIGASAFLGNANIESITIPESVTNIGPYAFYDCSLLDSIESSGNLTKIGASAFEGTMYYNNKDNYVDNILYLGASLIVADPEITSANIKEGTTLISDRAFEDHTLLESVKMPDSLKHIGDNAFAYCCNLISAVIGQNVETIGMSSFEFCEKLESIVIPDSVKSLGDSAFMDCMALKTAELGEGITEIEAYTFCGCYALESINLNSNITSIYEEAFSYCSTLKSITIPDSVTSIDDYAFYCCYGLESVTLSKNITVIEEGLFSGCAAIKSIDIPDGVTSILYGAFEDCISLESITIPQSVYEIADNAFSGCENLTVYGYKGSYTEQYVSENDISFVDVENPDAGKGDVNGDGDVTMEDVVLLQKHIAKLTQFTPEQLKSADVTGDGEITMLDVTTVQKYIAKLIERF